MMQTLPPLFASLKFRIVALSVLTGIAAAAGTGSMVLQATQVELQRQLFASERADRERTAWLLSSKLETLKSALTATAARVSAGALNDPQAMQSFLLDQPALGALFDNLAAVAADGSLRANVARGAVAETLSSVGDQDYFKRTMQGDQLVVSEPFIGRVSAAPVVLLLAPVLNPAGQTVGALVGTLQLQSNSLLAEPGGARDDGTRDLVIERSGIVLSHPDRARIMGRAGQEPGFATTFARWQGAGGPLDTQALVEVSDGHMVSLAGIPQSDWALVRVTPRTNAMAPLDAARRAAVLAALLAGLVSALLAGAVSWFIARPISRLRDRAERMLAGATTLADEELPKGGEIGALSKAFHLLLQTRDRQGGEMQALMLQLQAVLDNAEVGLVLTRRGCFEMVSRQFCFTFGMEREQLIGQSTRLIHLSDEAYEAFSARAMPAFMEQGFFDGEVELQRHSGEPFWARMRGRAVLPGDRSKGTIWVLTDITTDKAQRDRLTYAASHDRLTGVVNRAAFEAMLELASARAQQAPFCLLFIDLDRFKQVNDTGGHAAGDALLRDIALALAAQLRKSDTVARLGGDEFAVLLPQCPLSRAQEIAERLRAAVEGYRLNWEGQSFSVGASIGLMVANGAHASAAEVMRAADAACYEAKRAGRNQVAMAA